MPYGVACIILQGISLHEHHSTCQQFKHCHSWQVNCNASAPKPLFLRMLTSRIALTNDEPDDPRSSKAPFRRRSMSSSVFDSCPRNTQVASFVVCTQGCTFLTCPKSSCSPCNRQSDFAQETKFQNLHKQTSCPTFVCHLESFGHRKRFC
jgi:hypothetical protein